MAYAQSKTIDIDSIPVIDTGPLHSGNSKAVRSVVSEIRQAAEKVGFFYIRNHGIPKDVIEQAFRAAQGFVRPKTLAYC